MERGYLSPAKLSKEMLAGIRAGSLATQEHLVMEEQEGGRPLGSLLVCVCASWSSI